MSEDAPCKFCAKKPGRRAEYTVNEAWFVTFLCDDCRPLLMNAFRPLVRISESIDTTRTYLHNGYITRANIETGHLKAVGSNLSAPMVMGLRVVGGIPDFIGRVVQAKFTEDEVLKIAAFLVSKPQWAHVIEAMLAQRCEFSSNADLHEDAGFIRRLTQAGKRAIAEMRGLHRKAS